MKQNKENISRILVLVVLFVLANAPQFTLLRQVNAQDPHGISMPTLQLRDLGIDNEARQITSLIGAHVNFFKRSADHRKKGGLTPREAREIQNEGDQRKADVSTLRSQLQSLINKLKQGNHWNETFDAQFAAALKKESDRSLLSQSGGARKLFEAAVSEVNSLRDDIDEELRHISAKLNPASNRGDRSFAAHARPPVGKVCTILLAAILLAGVASAQGAIPGYGTVFCTLVKRYNEKGCVPGPAVAPNCN